MESNQSVRKIKKNYRRQYWKSLRAEHEKLVIKQIKAEWQEADKAAKKHEFIVRAKGAAAKTVSTILRLALCAGALTVAVAAPKMFAVFGRGFLRGPRGDVRGYRRYIADENLPSKIRRGSADGYWKYVRVADRQYHIQLTKKGKQAALRIALQEFRLRAEPIWDKQWRVVMFDIPRKYNWARTALRKKLVEIGMHPLQDSVFIYPYDCVEAVKMWVDLLSAKNAVEIVTATFCATTDAKLRKLFKVS